MQTESQTRRQNIVSFFDSQPRSSEAVAAAAERLWARFESPLRRMIGPIGVASLFERCVELNKVKHPWLPADKLNHFTERIAYQLIWNSMAKQPVSIAQNAGIALYSTLFEVLMLLIGERLTARVFSTTMHSTITHSYDIDAQGLRLRHSVGNDEGLLPERTNVGE